MGDEHALHIADDTDAGDDAGTDGELRAPRGERGELEEGGVTVQQQLDPLPHQQSAAVTVPLLVTCPTAGAGEVELLLKLGEDVQLRLAVGAVELRTGGQ